MPIFNNHMVEPQTGHLLKHPSDSRLDSRLYFSWRAMICDGAAHKAAWSSKGDSGTKFCMLCANATGHKPTMDSQAQAAGMDPVGDPGFIRFWGLNKGLGFRFGFG